MPFLTLPIALEGLLIDVAVAMSTHRVDMLKAAGLLYPAPVWVVGIIDTGASVSAVSGDVIRSLGLVSTGDMEIRSVVTGDRPHTCPTFDVCLAFAKPQPTVMHVNLQVIEAQFTGRKFNVLIGRDVLKRCLLFYNGEAGCFTLSF